MTRLLALLLVVFAGAAPDAQELYRAGRYTEALAAYEAVIASSPEPSGAALYNAGNCAFRLADYPKAALYYRRAGLRTPDDPRVRFNLQLTQRKLGIPPESDSLLASLTQAARQVAPVKILAAAAALEIAGLVLVVALRRRKGFVLTGAVLLATSGALGALYVKRAYGAVERQGMVMVPEASVYAEPREDLGVTLKVKVGEVLRIEEGSARWVRVRYEGREGWVRKEEIGVID